MMQQQQQITLNPQRAAEWALEFLRRAPITGDDIERYQLTRSFLNAIATGELTVASPAPGAPVMEPANPNNGKTLGGPTAELPDVHR